VLREKYAWALLLLCLLDACSVSTTKSNCRSTCGNLTIEFPFGISLDCAYDERFLLRCDEKEQKLFTNSSNLEVKSISLQGELEVLLGVIRACSNVRTTGSYEHIEDGGFAFSSKNDVTVVGCSTEVVWLYFTKVRETSGTCSTECRSSQQMDDSCSGYGCCKVPIPSGAYHLDVEPVSSYRDGSEHMGKLNPCIYVFLVKAGYFIFDLQNLRNVTRFPVILDWAMKGTCDTSFCGEKSNCYNNISIRGDEHSCKCLKGFEGNPYLQHGCKVSVIGFLLFLIGICCLILKLKLWKRAKLKERRFEENGGILLVQRLLDEGPQSSNASIKIFTEKDIKTATKGYHKTKILGRGGQGVVYKGILSDGVQVAVKKSRDLDRDQVAQFINELLLLSRINHPHVVSLLGCCLETQVPLLVYEFVSGGTLYDNLLGSCLSWSDRLRIAVEIAETLSYLHFSAPVPIVHRDVKPANILLDEMLSAKLADFGASRLVPANTEQLTTLVQGTLGYLDPEYLQTSTFSDKSDVYSYGVVLMELVSGEKSLCFNRPPVSHLESALRENRLSDVMEQRVVNAENHGVVYQVKKSNVKNVPKKSI
ncbi:unnamed protein product, partial [Thlaspi arvense]